MALFLAIVIAGEYKDASRAAALDFPPGAAAPVVIAQEAQLSDVDLCPNLAEDQDGVQSEDGCPDTDASVTVVKEESIITSKDEETTHQMTITVKNGNYPADVRLTLLSVSKVGLCEVKLVPVPMIHVLPSDDTYSQYYTDENHDSVIDTLFSEIDRNIFGMAPFQQIVLIRSYKLICLVGGPLVNPYEIQADVLPLPPVQEENLGNPPPCPSPWCMPAVIGGPETSSDNVHKNFPDINSDTPTPTPPTSPPSATPAVGGVVALTTGRPGDVGGGAWQVILALFGVGAALTGSAFVWSRRLQ